jgi:dolichyl-phosphate beta-glucosyltransferase
MRARMAEPLTVVVPCYNEAERLDGGPLLSFLDERPEARLVFVNDGSTDATQLRLEELAAQRPDRIRVLSLDPNRGKAEAVRQGMLKALAEGGTREAKAASPPQPIAGGAGPSQGPGQIIGYLDADLSTPTSELPRLLAALARPGVDVALGARVALLGTDIHRSPVRHYLGRVFASIAAGVLQARIYDTQCGAKLFRASPALSAALGEPFLSRWAFDVELLGRLLAGSPSTPPLPLTAIVEVPLATWRDVKGSKLGPVAMARTLKDLGTIGLDLAARRRVRRVSGRS